MYILMQNCKYYLFRRALIIIAKEFTLQIILLENWKRDTNVGKPSSFGLQHIRGLGGYVAENFGIYTLPNVFYFILMKLKSNVLVVRLRPKQIVKITKLIQKYKFEQIWNYNGHLCKWKCGISSYIIKFLSLGDSERYWLGKIVNQYNNTLRNYFFFPSLSNFLISIQSFFIKNFTFVWFWGQFPQF